MTDDQRTNMADAPSVPRVLPAGNDAIGTLRRRGIREREHREVYRREHKLYPEWIDLGGEG